MDSDTVSGSILFLDHIFIRRFGTGNKKSHLGTVAVQSIKKLFRIGPGTVVKGQVDDLSFGIGIRTFDVGKIF